MLVIRPPPSGTAGRPDRGSSNGPHATHGGLSVDGSRFRSLIGPVVHPSLQLSAPARRRRAASELPVLGLACTIRPGDCGRIVQAVLARALAPGRPAGTVVLALGAGTELDAGACKALHALADQLEPTGIRLRLATSSGPVREQLARNGLITRLGTGAICPSLRAAVLSVYAELPGPGLVTEEIRACLLTPAEPIEPGGSAAGGCRSLALAHVPEQAAGGDQAQAPLEYRHQPRNDSERTQQVHGDAGERAPSGPAGHVARFRRIRGPHRSSRLAGLYLAHARAHPVRIGMAMRSRFPAGTGQASSLPGGEEPR